MADNFDLAKFLRNNQLLNEGIGGYKDIVPYAGPEKKLDGFGDEFDQVDPVEEMDDSMTGDKGWQYDDEDDIDDPDADIVNDFVQGMRPYYEKDPSFIKKVIDAIRGKGFGAKMYDAGFRMNEDEGYGDTPPEGPNSFLPTDQELPFNISQDEFFGRMMGLAHPEFEDVSPVVKKTIDNLRADGFDDQDIIDFLATDFSLDEEVSVSSSGVQMEGEEFNWKPIDQQGKTPFKNLTVTITDDKIKVLADDGFSSQSYTKEDIKDAMKTGEYLRFRGKNLQLNTKMKAWANS